MTMIIVAGHIDLPDEAAAKVAEHARALMAETRAEDGCIVYNLTADLERPGRLHVYEEWRDLDALMAHGRAPHMKTWRAALKDLGVIDRAVKRIDAGEVTPL